MRITTADIISPRKPIRRLAALAVLFLLACLRITIAEGAYRVTGISFEPSPGEIGMNIRTDGPAVYDYFTMEETQPQLVIDLADAVHDLGQYRFAPPVTDVIQRVRTSQYRPYPHPVVRIVLDLRQMVPFELSIVEQGLIVRMSSPAAVPGTGRIVRETSERSLAKPEPAIMTGTADKPADAEAPAPTVEKTVAEKRVSEPDPPAISEHSPGEPLTMESPPPAPAEMETVAAETAGPDSAVFTPQPGSLMARLMALGIREPVSYTNGGRRDPFVPLPAQQKVEFGQTPLPDVQKLSIVGILQGADGYRALVQDDEDNGYVLRKGDRVLYGYVARIEAERVIFYLNRRGLDRTVILKIPQ